MATTIEGNQIGRLDISGEKQCLFDRHKPIMAAVHDKGRGFDSVKIGEIAVWSGGARIHRLGVSRLVDSESEHFFDQVVGDNSGIVDHRRQ